MALSLFGLCTIILVGVATRRQAGREWLGHEGALLAPDGTEPRIPG